MGNLEYGYKARLYTVSFCSFNPLSAVLAIFHRSVLVKIICKKVTMIFRKKKKELKNCQKMTYPSAA
jgi:hypothetical protein